MVKGNPITIPQLAKLLGVSRIAIYKKVKKGQIPAKKAGKIYIISDSVVADILGKKLSLQKKKQIDAAVGKTVKQYGEVLKRLGKE
jgi:excisionase family DNA binding protein